jgi:F-type H+-transporting ATPase subunit a
VSHLKDPKLWLWVVVVIAAMVASRLLLPVPLPHIQLPAEPIPGVPTIPIPFVGELVITNTIIAVLMTDVMLVIAAYFATRRLQMVPSGMQNLFEAIIEFWENMSVQMIGEKLTRRYLPLFLTLFTLIALANWSELIPGYDYFGFFFQPEHHEAEGASGPEIEHTFFEVEWTGEPGHSFGIGMRRVEDAVVEAAEAEGVDEHVAGEAVGGEHAAGPDDTGEHDADAAHGVPEGYAFVPFLRAAATDLSFTLALALVAFVAIQMLGFQSLGPSYLKKFFNFDFSGGIGRGVMNIFVGLLELISELARIVSFAFRLFGNIFAGQTLLFVIPFLIPFLAVVPVFGLELFVGMIQAFVFAILTLAFMAVAMIAHNGDHH